MKQIFCTLFNSNYLDKGLVLYDSMCRHISHFTLYVFAFDDKCYEILKSENLENMVIVSLKEFENPDLLKVKKERTPAEYCWTCSSWTIKYVLEHCGESICTYIDADMMFFSSPQPIFDDMKKNKCSTIIVPHRFKTIAEEVKAHNEVGSYCVEFNTFVKDENGLEALNWWAKKCLEWCYYAVPGTTEWYGDQKYLNVFPEKFKGVYICNHYGVGLAPWNNCLVDWAKGEINEDNEYIPHIRVIKTGEVFPVVIYHFENVSFVTKHILNASSSMKSKQLHTEIYDFYISKLMEKRMYIENKYQFKMNKKRRVLTKNLIMRVYQKYISPIRRINKLSDLYWIKEESYDDNAK